MTRIVIGRDPGCDVVLDDPYASPRHAEIVYADGGWLVCDLRSTNGTFVNGRRADPKVPVYRDSTIRVGHTDLKAATLLPTAVAELNALVAAKGYRQDDVDALRLLAGAGRSAEEAAQLILTARQRSVNPLALTQSILRRSAAR